MPLPPLSSPPCQFQLNFDGFDTTETMFSNYACTYNTSIYPCTDDPIALIILMQMKSRMFMCCVCYSYSGSRRVFMPSLDWINPKRVFFSFGFVLLFVVIAHVESYLLMGVVHLESWIEWNMSNMVWTLDRDIRHLCIYGPTASHISNMKME